MILKVIYRAIVPSKIRYYIGVYFSYLSDKQFKGEILNKRVCFYSLFVEQGDLCFDIGANIGNRIAPMLEIGAKVIAIEPQLSCVKKMKKRFGDKIVVEQKGCGEKDGILDFYTSNFSFLSTFSKEQINMGRFEFSKWKEPVKVSVVSIDSLIIKYGLPNFIKIDVEGFEYDVLKGLSTPVRMISFEYTVPEMIHHLIECINRIYEISDRYYFNYSIGETMEFAMRDWLNKEAIINLVKSANFQNTSFGDIYAKIN